MDVDRALGVRPHLDRREMRHDGGGSVRVAGNDGERDRDHHERTLRSHARVPRWSGRTESALYSRFGTGMQDLIEILSAMVSKKAEVPDPQELLLDVGERIV